MAHPHNPDREPENPSAATGDPTPYIPTTSWPEPPATPQAFAPRFDPMTGQLLQSEPAVRAPIFDPITGRRLVRKKRRPAVAALGALLAVVVVAAAIATAVVMAGENKKDDERDAAAARERACVAELQPVYDALLAIDGRMSTGANIEAFSGLVGAASTALRQVDATVIDDQQCAMHSNLSTLVTQYGLILSGWNDCLFEYDYCDSDTDIDVSSALSLVSIAFGLVDESKLGTEEEQVPLDVTDDSISGLVEFL